MILRPYQAKAVQRLIELITRRPLLVAPTGSGKTVMGSELVRQTRDFLCSTCLWLAHRKELIQQAARQLHSLGLDCGIIMAGVSSAPLHRLQIASVQTLVHREMPPAELIVIDEAHHATAANYQKILAEYPRAAVVGLTATPFRLDGRGLGDLFGELVEAASVKQLCEDGTLHAPRVYSHSSPDLSSVRVTAGDFNLKQAGDAMNKSVLVADIVSTWQRRAAGLKTVIFATNVEHSRAIVDAFTAAGVRAEHLDGSTGQYDRDAILMRLQIGETTVVSNCQVLTEGWDLPALQCAIIARPTASLCLHLQMIGRIMRQAEGKAGAIVLDHAGNHHRHGSVTRKIAYSLGGVVRSASEPLGLKTCPDCFLMVEAAVSVCPECGHVFTPEDRELIKTVAGELTEFEEQSYEYRAEWWDYIEEQRRAADYAPGWSSYKFKERFGVWPLVLADGSLLNPDRATIEQKREVWQRIEARRQQRGYAEGWTAHKYREIFGVWPVGVSDRYERQHEITQQAAAMLSQRWNSRS